MSTEGRLARLRERTLNHRIAMRQQRIEIIDEGLHFRRIPPFHPALAAGVDVGKAAAEMRERRHPTAHVPEAGDHADGHECQREPLVGVDGAMEEKRILPVMQHDRGGECHRADEQPDRPENGAGQDARTEGDRARHGAVPMRYPSPRTVSISDAPSLRRRRAMNTSTVFESRSKACE